MLNHTKGDAMRKDVVTLKALAQEIGIHHSNLRKYALKHGVNLVRIRPPESKGQLTLAVIPEDAEYIRELRQSEGFGNTAIIAKNGEGVFYAVQLIPEFDPLRVKLGFTQSMNERLQAHRTSAPSAKLVKSWPSRRSWESAAIACLTRTDCKLIANEIYQCDDLDALIHRGDTFFRLLP